MRRMRILSFGMIGTWNDKLMGARYVHWACEYSRIDEGEFDFEYHGWWSQVRVSSNIIGFSFSISSSVELSFSSQSDIILFPQLIDDSPWISLNCYHPAEPIIIEITIFLQLKLQYEYKLPLDPRSRGNSTWLWLSLMLFHYTYYLDTSYRRLHPASQHHTKTVGSIVMRQGISSRLLQMCLQG